jgi:hypothetical protein
MAWCPTPSVARAGSYLLLAWRAPGTADLASRKLTRMSNDERKAAADALRRALEYADMDPRVWSEIIRPALADRSGWAVFIGTPKGRL